MSFGDYYILAHWKTLCVASTDSARGKDEDTGCSKYGGWRGKEKRGEGDINDFCGVNHNGKKKRECTIMILYLATKTRCPTTSSIHC